MRYTVSELLRPTGSMAVRSKPSGTAVVHRETRYLSRGGLPYLLSLFLVGQYSAGSTVQPR